MPIPARFVIRRQGPWTLSVANAGPDYTRRPEPAQTFESLDEIK